MKCLNCGSQFALNKKSESWRGFKLGRFMCSLRCLIFIRDAHRMDENAHAIAELEKRLGQRLKTFAGSRWYQILLSNRAWYWRYFSK